MSVWGETLEQDIDIPSVVPLCTHLFSVTCLCRHSITRTNKKLMGSFFPSNFCLKTWLLLIVEASTRNLSLGSHPGWEKDVWKLVLRKLDQRESLYVSGDNTWDAPGFSVTPKQAHHVSVRQFEQLHNTFKMCSLQTLQSNVSCD